MILKLSSSTLDSVIDYLNSLILVFKSLTRGDFELSLDEYI